MGVFHKGESFQTPHGGTSAFPAFAIVCRLGPTIVINGCRIKGLDTLPRKSLKSGPEHGERRQPHTLRFGHCL